MQTCIDTDDSRSAYPIGANGQIGLPRVIDSVALLGLEIRTSPDESLTEGLLEAVQPLIEAGDALRACQEIEGDLLIPVNVQEQVTAIFVHLLQGVVYLHMSKKQWSKWYSVISLEKGY